MVGFDTQGVGRILEVLFDGTITLPAGPEPVERLNSPVLQKDEIGIFTSLWGSHPRSRAVQGSGRVVEVELTNDVVTAVREAAGTGPIPPARRSSSVAKPAPTP